MLNPMHSPFNETAIPNRLFPDITLTDVIPNRPKIVHNPEPIQIKILNRQPISDMANVYAVSAYQWLEGVLDGLIDFENRHGNYGATNLTEDEYQWLDEVLEELIFSVGDNEKHSLAPLMDLIILIISEYESTYVRKLTQQYSNQADASEFNKVGVDECAAYAFFSIGFVLYQGNYREKSQIAYDKALNLKYDLWQVLYNRGITWNDLKKHRKAIIDFNNVIDLNPGFPDAYYSRGIAKYNLNQIVGAMHDFNKAIELDSKFGNAYYIRGFLSFVTENYKDALEDFNQAIDLNPNFIEAYTFRAAVKANLKRTDDAKTDFLKALELAKLQEKTELIAFVNEQLHILDNLAP